MFSMGLFWRCKWADEGKVTCCYVQSWYGVDTVSQYNYHGCFNTLYFLFSRRLFGSQLILHSLSGHGQDLWTPSFRKIIPGAHLSSLE
jgi:hypothetical protein